MTFLAPVSATTNIIEHEEALALAKQWRSDCLDLFSEAELQIGCLLRCLNKTGSMLGKVKLGQQTRPSFDELRKQLEAKGHGKTERQRLNATLDPLANMLDWRPKLTHGVLGVWLGLNGRWLFTLKHADGAWTGPVRWYAYPQSEAEQLAAALRLQVDDFANRSERLRSHLVKLPKA